MLKLWSALPILGLIFCSLLASAHDCEDGLKAPVASLFQITKMATAKGLVKVEDLRSLFQGGGWGNPFAKDVSTTSTSGYRRAFEVFSEAMSPAQRIEFRELVLEHVAKELKGSVEAKRASRDTRGLIIPTPFVQLPAEYKAEWDAQANLVWYQGRPLLIGGAGRYGESSDYYADLFNRETNGKMFVTFAHNEPVHGSSLSNRPDFSTFMLEGKAYIFSSMNRRTVEIPAGRETYGHSLRVSAPSNPRSFFEKMSPSGSVAIDVDGDVKVVAGWNNARLEPDASSYLGIVSLNKSPSSWTKIANGVTVEAPRAFKLDGHSLVSWNSRDEGLKFIDLSENNKIYPTISLHQEPGGTQTRAIAYVVNGEWRAFYVQKDPQGQGYIYSVADIKIGKHIVDIGFENVSFSFDTIEPVEVEGKPFALISRYEDLLWIDLTNNTIQSIPAAQVSTDAGSFVFQNTTYLVYGTHEGKIGIVNPLTGWSQTTQFEPHKRIARVLPFVYRGHPFAFVTAVNEPPRLIELAQVSE